jgi:hypothetical protein
MPGLVPGIHEFWQRSKDVDGRDEPGHDEEDFEKDCSNRRCLKTEGGLHLAEMV